MLRHTVATLAYRAAKVLRGTPAGFSTFAGAAPQTPGRILAHLCDLFDWALHLADGSHKWNDTAPGAWEDDCARFFAALEAFDRRLAAGAPACDAGRLFQGPIADALTHVGQLAMLRRLAGIPMKGENYFRAEIVTGRCGADQPAPRAEFAG
ncbi:MAG: hypothetical protein JST11_17140 [Acidobacteria bacterium]|nr:hypothetical protein [Acidobacteriota bacterium]